MTDHFMEHYGKKARYFIYNSDNLSQIDSYSSSGDINVMIINTQALRESEWRAYGRDGVWRSGT